MAETVLQTIELCKLTAVTGKAVYDASIKVANNFKKQRRELGARVNGSKTQVERLEKKLEERRAVLEQNANIKDLNILLKRIMEPFQRIKKFFDQLEKYEGQTGIVKLLQKAALAVKYYNIERKFKDFNQILVDFEEDLNEILKVIGFEELVDIHLAVYDLRQEQSNRSADFENFKDHMVEGVQDQFKEFMDEYMRNLEFDKRRIAPDGNLPNLIRPHEITEEKSLSKGRYWTIHTAILDKEKVTVKRIRDVDDHNVQASFQKETMNLKRFFHGSIVRVIGMCDEEKEKFLVLEYMEKGDLSTLLHESREEISLTNKVNLATTAALAFYCMSHKLVHSSLRTEKFLVDKHYTAKLSGMRYAKTFSSAKKYATKKPVVDVACYLAPEFQYKPGEPTLQADVYGFGIVLWEIFTQRKPFSTLAKEIGKEPNYVEVRKFVVDDEREEYDIGSGDIETKVGSIIRDCRALDPKNRPPVAEILDRLERLDIPIEDLED